MRFIKYDYLFDRRFIGFLLPFPDEDVNILNECSNRALTAGFADAAFVVTSNCSGNNFNKRPVAGKKNTGWGTVAMRAVAVALCQAAVELQGETASRGAVALALWRMTTESCGNLVRGGGTKAVQPSK